MAVFLVALLALAAAGCGGNSPSSATTDMLTLLGNRDFSGAYDAFASSSQIRANVSKEEFVSEMGASLPEGSSLSDIRITDEKIDGDTATVSWSATVKAPNVPDQQLNDSFQLTKEDGVWKVQQ